MVRSLIHVTDIWLFCSQAGQAALLVLIRLGGQEIGIHPLKPLWENSLVVKLDVSIGIARNALSGIHESLEQLHQKSPFE